MQRFTPQPASNRMGEVATTGWATCTGQHLSFGKWATNCRTLLHVETPDSQMGKGAPHIQPQTRGEKWQQLVGPPVLDNTFSFREWATNCRTLLHSRGRRRGSGNSEGGRKLRGR